MLVLLIVAGCAVFGAAVFLCYAFCDRLRSKYLGQEARRLGFSFEAVGHPFEGSNVDGLTLLEKGQSTLAQNVVRGIISDTPVVIFEKPVYVSEHPVGVTFAAFRVPRADLPLFHVRSKDALERLEGALSAKPADFQIPDRNFTREFCLECSNEAGSREFFTPARLQCLCTHAHKLRIESSPEWLLIYRPGCKVRAKDLSQFLQMTLTVASGLLH